MSAGGQQDDGHYDLCLSFACEQRDYVAEVAHLLRDRDVKVFYDSYETADLLGRDLIEHLTEIYSERSRWCLLFASADYRRKVWPNLERAAAVERALSKAEAYILPIRFDDTSIPGVPDSLGHVDARRTSPSELVGLVLEKLGRQPVNPLAVAASLLVIVADRAPVDTETIMRFALVQAGVRLPDDHQSHVDGRSAVMVPLSSATELDVLTSLVPAIESVLDERVNAIRSGPPPALRIAVHRGVVPIVGDWSCYDAGFTIDMALAPVGAELLGAAPRADSVVIVSHRIYQDVVTRARYGVDPSAYRRIDLPRSAVGWARITGYPTLATTQGTLAGGSGPGVVAKKTKNVFHDSVIGHVGDIYHQYGGAHD